MVWWLSIGMFRPNLTTGPTLVETGPLLSVEVGQSVPTRVGTGPNLSVEVGVFQLELGLVPT